MKKVYNTRYYPWYHGRQNTQYSYRSFYVAKSVDSVPGRDKYLIGYCDDETPSGWVTGIKGAYAARTWAALKNLKNFKKETDNASR